MAYAKIIVGEPGLV